MTRVFAISGYSGTGKTTLVEDIVRSLCAKGYAVVTAKSSQHDLGTERGSDTARHREAGAAATIFIGGSVGSEPDERMRRLVEKLGSLNPDVLIVEGMKSSPIPKIWCVRDTGHIAQLPPETKAVVTWSKPTCDWTEVPIFQSHAIETIVGVVMSEAIELTELMNKKQ